MYVIATHRYGAMDSDECLYWTNREKGTIRIGDALFGAFAVRNFLNATKFSNYETAKASADILTKAGHFSFPIEVE
jgi:hypothetical protein